MSWVTGRIWLGAQVESQSLFRKEQQVQDPEVALALEEQGTASRPVWRGLSVLGGRREGLVAARPRRVWEDPCLRHRSPALGVQTRLYRAPCWLTASLPLADYEWPWERRLSLAVSISCIAIVFICLSCYWSIIK